MDQNQKFNQNTQPADNAQLDQHQQQNFNTEAQSRPQQNYSGQAQSQPQQNFYGQPQGQPQQNFNVQPQSQPQPQQNFYSQQPQYAPIATYPSTDQFGNPLPQKSKIACGLFHILLGYIGVGNFYMGKIGLGIVDVLFCWTTIPGIVNLIRGIIVLCESDEEFARKYNCIPV
ncbi:MAG: TM2 domain-containing protein [Lachnospiraceae bacterium]|nr:TM2 domain-containing protein [Lachnospiraceae bacterium]MDD7702438.1 TM2 domain-containing protein [Lachnospiraceae bacterium]MDY3302081.1 TM2 domain-containing protein [Lachnospiraceae bacterium]